MPAACSDRTIILNSLHGRLRRRPAWRSAVRGEEAERVVAPVVDQPLLDQEAVVDVVVDRQQLDGGDAQVEEVLDRRLGGQPGVGAAELLGHAGMQLREALDVDLVDERLVPGRPGGRSSPQVKAVSITAASGANGGAVALVERQVGLGSPSL